MKILIVALCIFASNAFALDAAQKQTLQTAALAEPSIQSCLTDGNDICVANWFNEASSFTVWRTVLLKKTITESDAFAFALVDGLTVGKRDEWTNFIFDEGRCNPSRLNVREGFLDVWSGTAAKTAVYNAIIALSKRLATNAERILASGTGSDADPGVLSFEGNISLNDVSSILRP